MEMFTNLISVALLPKILDCYHLKEVTFFFLDGMLLLEIEIKNFNMLSRNNL